MSELKLALFDCDGTLVDSAKLIHEVMCRTFVHFGFAAPALAQTKAIIGLTLDIAIARIQGKPHADTEAVAMMAYYKSIFGETRKESGFESRFSRASARLWISLPAASAC